MNLQVVLVLRHSMTVSVSRCMHALYFFVIFDLSAIDVCSDNKASSCSDSCSEWDLELYSGQIWFICMIEAAASCSNLAGQLCKLDDVIAVLMWARLGRGTRQYCTALWCEARGCVTPKKCALSLTWSSVRIQPETSHSIYRCKFNENKKSLLHKGSSEYPQ